VIAIFFELRKPIRTFGRHAVHSKPKPSPSLSEKVVVYKKNENTG
jgi:hypothetical protein